MQALSPFGYLLVTVYDRSCLFTKTVTIAVKITVYKYSRPVTVLLRIVQLASFLRFKASSDPKCPFI